MSLRIVFGIHSVYIAVLGALLIVAPDHFFAAFVDQSNPIYAQYHQALPQTLIAYWGLALLSFGLILVTLTFAGNDSVLQAVSKTIILVLFLSAFLDYKYRTGDNVAKIATTSQGYLHSTILNVIFFAGYFYYGVIAASNSTGGKKRS